MLLLQANRVLVVVGFLKNHFPFFARPMGGVVADQSAPEFLNQLAVNYLMKSKA